MKKLLLLPVLLMTMLVGCNDKKSQEAEKETIYTPVDWFKDTDVFENELEFSADLDVFYDYEKTIANRLLKSFDFEFKHPEKVDDVDQRDLMTYTIKKEMGPYTKCTIRIHEKCIETEAYGVANNKGIKQYARYQTYGYGVTRLLAFSFNRSQEIAKTQKEEYEAAKEVATLENFYQGIEESTTNPIATFSNVTKEDVNHALLDDFKDLINPNNKASFYPDRRDAFMSYGLSEDFILKFYLDSNEDCVAVLTYEYKGSFNDPHTVTNSYSVSRDKVDNIIRKITGVAN